MPPKELIPLSEVPALVIGMKRTVTRQTVWNWAAKGVRRDPASESAGRLKLAVIKSGAHFFTSPTNVQNFLNAYAKITGRGNRI